MLANWDVADWYAAGALGLNDEQIQKRVAARSAAQKKSASEALRAAAAIFASVEPVSDDVALPLLSPLKAVETSFSRVRQEHDLRIFAAWTIDSAGILDAGAVAARLAVVAAAFGGHRSFGKLDHLVDTSRFKLATAAQQVRAIAGPRKAVHVPELDDAKLSGDAAAAGIPAAIKSLRNCVVELISALQHVERNSAAHEGNAAERMELLMLLQTGELSDGTAVADLPASDGAIRVGFELGRALKVPASDSATVRTGRSLLGQDFAANVTWAELLAADCEVASVGGLTLPLTNALAAAKGARIAALRDCGINVAETDVLSLAQVLAQAAIEAQAARAWAG